MDLENSLSSIAPADLDGLNQQVYMSLRSAILRGTFALGERLSPTQLAKHFQVSVMPVRDALKRLETDGLVEILPRRGVFITQVSRRTVEEVFQIRQIIERACVGMLDPISPDVIAQLQKTLQEMENLREGEIYRDYPRYVQLDAQFHNLLVSLPKNERLSEMYRELHWPIQLVLVLSPSKYHRAQQGKIEHAAIVDAIIAGDATLAQEMVSRHLDNARNDLLTRLPINSWSIHCAQCSRFYAETIRNREEVKSGSEPAETNDLILQLLHQNL